jgi:hypothetical protein
MGIVDGSTVLTEADRDRIIWSTIGTLTGEYESLSCDRSLVDQSLSLECIDDTIEGGEIHPGFSFFPDEFLSEVREGDTAPLSEEFDKSFSGFGDTRF